VPHLVCSRQHIRFADLANPPNRTTFSSVDKF
jgi:hypothetical protein